MAQFTTEAGYANLDPHCLTVGTSETAFPAPNASNVKNPEKIFVQALLTNTVSIVVGLAGVAADGTQGGFILPPGANIQLACNRDDLLRAIASSANQKLSVVYLSNPN